MTNPAYLGRGCSEGKATNNVVSSPGDKRASKPNSSPGRFSLSLKAKEKRPGDEVGSKHVTRDAYAARNNEAKGLLTLLGKVLKNYINPWTVVTSPIK